MKKLLRLLKIIYIIKKYNLLALLINKKYKLIIKTLTFLTKIINKNILKMNDGEKLKKAFEELGPIFIKFGQILSIRTDLIPIIINNELKKLQTNIIPFKGTISKNIIEHKFKINIKNLFKNFNENPIAAASIAQIHTGVLKNNEKVIIKILKPNIKNYINLDLGILKYISKIINLIPKFKRLKIPDIIEEINNTVKDELNFKKEAANSIKFKTKNKSIYIPKIYWEYTNEDILILEYINGINILNKNELKKQNYNIKDLSIKLIEIFYFQVFKNNFFHADLHPGNILINRKYKNINITLIDFGIVSSINNNEKNYLLENILAFSKKDYKKVANLHIKSNSMIIDTNIDDLEREICFIFEPILNKSIKKISFERTLVSLINLSKKFKMQLQPRLLLFQKTLITIEGLTRNLYPNLNMWKITRQTLEKIILSKNIKNYFSKKLIKNLKMLSNKKIKNNKITVNNNLLEKTLIFTTGYIIGIIIFIIFLKI